MGGLSHRSVAELMSKGSDALVVGLLDSPHQHAESPGLSVLKGVPPERMRRLILGELEDRGRVRRGSDK